MRLHDVDARDLFGDGVFHLHAGVHLNEVKLARIHIHQKFDRARTFIVHVLANFFAEITQLFALGARQIGGRGALNHFLVAALHGTVAFPQVIDCAVAVAQYLHFDVARTHDHLFKETWHCCRTRPQPRGGLPAPFPQLRFRIDGAHAATTTAP